MKTYISLVLAATTAFVTTPAFAETVSGPRVEVLVGYDKVSLDLSDFGLGSESEDGVFYGVGLGYDLAVSPTTAIGLDVEYADSSTKVVYDVAPEYVKLSAGRDLYVGGRATFAVSETFNVYAKAGYTNARIKLFATDGVDTYSDSANGDGVRAGVGGQLSFGQIYALAEYRYSNYEDGFSRNQALVGIGARF